MKKIALIMIAAVVFVPLVVEAGRGPGAKGGGDQACSLNSFLEDLPLEKLRKKERKNLLFMREEEKLARDAYLSLFEEWGLRVFRNIAKAETKHMGSALAMIEKYGLDDPVGDNALGIFGNPKLQSLYEELSSLGHSSVESALLVGAAIEDVDIYDLQRSLNKTNNEDLEVLYQNLMKGSRNHLRAFTRLLEQYGVAYEPVFISIEEYDAIINSPNEQGIVGADGELLCGGGRP